MPLFKKKQKTLKKETSSKTKKSKTLKKSKVKKDKKSKKDKKELELVNNNPVNYTINQNNKCTINLEKGHEILLNVKTLRYILSDNDNYNIKNIIHIMYYPYISTIIANEPLEIITSTYSKMFNKIKEFTISKNINYYFQMHNFLALLTNNTNFFNKKNLDLPKVYPTDYSKLINLNSKIITKLLLLTPSLNKITKRELLDNQTILIKNNNILLVENCTLSYYIKKKLKNSKLNHVLEYDSLKKYRRVHARPYQYNIKYVNITGPGTVYIIDELNDRFL